MKRLLARGLLRKSQKDGRSLVTAASLAHFRRRYIGLTKLVRSRSSHRAGTSMPVIHGNRADSGVVKCSFPGVSRPEIENRIEDSVRWP